ncbi:MAG: flagellar biosynthesis protein [Opitutae bacterium]|nr:flagellar biosynthesis protein [Opitutae bacterium]
MSFATLVRFDRPLSGARPVGRATRLFTEAEVEAIRTAAYRQGSDSAHAAAGQQLVELRSEVQQLQEGVLAKLSHIDTRILIELSATLPSLALDLARRLLAGYEPPVEIVEKLCHEALEEIFPERANLELTVCPRDAALLESITPTWTDLYPGLRLCADRSLAPGECIVRSRFGLTDARRAAKLSALGHALHA